MTLYIVLGIIVLVAIVIWVLYNGLVQARNIVYEGYSGIDVQLKKRYELIPNLIEAVKGYNAHEAATLEKIVAERSGTSDNVADTAAHDGSITSTLKNFRIQVEQYPDLKANTQFLKLMEELSTVENELSMARRYYNGTVRDFNTKTQVFPGVLVASMFNFKKCEFYALPDESERVAPKVDLSKEE